MRADEVEVFKTAYGALHKDVHLAASTSFLPRVRSNGSLLFVLDLLALSVFRALVEQ